MPATPRELHVDRYLTDLSVAFAQESRDFISDKVFPVVPVKKASDQYVIYDRGPMWRTGNIQERPLGGKYDTGAMEQGRTVALSAVRPTRLMTVRRLTPMTQSIFVDRRWSCLRLR